jgi:hypothetical protein
MGGSKRLKQEYICSTCNSKTTYVKPDGREVWALYENKILCNRCDCRVRKNNKSCIESRKRYSKKTEKRRITFKNKRIVIDHNPRKGRCKKCGKKIGDSYVNYRGITSIIKKTDMHHRRYDPTDPTKYTIELCASCHGKIKRDGNRSR